MDPHTERLVIEKAGASPSHSRTPWTKTHSSDKDSMLKHMRSDDKTLHPSQISEPILLFSHTHEAGTTTALNHYTPESLHALSTLESKDADATDPSMSSCLPTQCEVGPDMAVLRTPESRRTPPSLTLEALIRKLNITSGTDTYHVMHWPRTSHADSPSPDSDTDHDDSFESDFSGADAGNPHGQALQHTAAWEDFGIDFDQDASPHPPGSPETDGVQEAQDALPVQPSDSCALEYFAGPEIGYILYPQLALPSNALAAQAGGLPHVQDILADARRVYYADSNIEVRASKLGGLGVFAARDLEAGQVILVEEPLMRLQSFSAEILSAYENLDADRRAIYDSLHGYSETEMCRVKKIALANAFLVTSDLAHRDPRVPSFAIMAVSSRFNHKCRTQRNVRYHYDTRREALVFVVGPDEPVARGDELCIDYGGTPLQLHERYGFICTCGCPRVTKTVLRKERDRMNRSW